MLRLNRLDSKRFSQSTNNAERYGHFSLAAESMYDHPFQWGSKRTGPDLARVGAKYSDEWHVTHLTNPRAIVPQSVIEKFRCQAMFAIGVVILLKSRIRFESGVSPGTPISMCR